MTEVTSELIAKVERHDKDLYFGNGKPALTIRMEIGEERLDTQDKALTELKEQNKTKDSRDWAILIGIAGTLALQLINMALHGVK